MLMDVALIAVGEAADHAAFFAYMGIAAAVVFANLGSAYGTAKSGVGISSMIRRTAVTPSITGIS